MIDDAYPRRPPEWSEVTRLFTYGKLVVNSLNIERAKPSGGKAGKGNNLTSTVQVIKRQGNTATVEKMFRFRMHDEQSLADAVIKAWKWADGYPDTDVKVIRGLCVMCGKMAAMNGCYEGGTIGVYIHKKCM